MTGDVLIDTNLFIYAYDPRVRSKQDKALVLLRRLVVNGRGRISTQILGEFFAAGTRRLDPPLSPAEAADQVVALAAAWPVLTVTPLVVLEAARGASSHRLHYWDAQLWATARLNQIPLILSEDFVHERVLEGVRFLNPFETTFDVAALD
jgi:predicted nucleic acid-binding protein